jgi:hypothetical protein
MQTRSSKARHVLLGDAERVDELAVNGSLPIESLPKREESFGSLGKGMKLDGAKTTISVSDIQHFMSQTVVCTVLFSSFICLRKYKANTFFYLHST